jgi:hypothetical protein
MKSIRSGTASLISNEEVITSLWQKLAQQRSAKQE